ncbi:MAG: hypothetical protein RBR43_09825 [Desulfuromonadaceae bacterium]|nr:hypothetical protein [Desulfuromonadaceae bacterium]
MQLTFEQYMQLLAMTGAALIYGIMSYHCGLKDRAEKIKAANQKAFRATGENTRLKTELAISERRAETNAHAVELLNDELEAANLIKQRQHYAAMLAEDTADAYIDLTAHMKSEIEAMRLKVLSENQGQTIRQASSQLIFTAQLMEALKNHESAKTQRTLAVRLLTIVDQADQAAKEAA